MTRRVRHHILFVALGSASALACHTLNRPAPQLRATLVTDSAQFAVHRQGILFIGKIGFTFVNTTKRVISRAGCGGPGWPELEKEVDGRWVTAYHQVSLACRTVPDLSWEPGAQLHDVFQLAVAERGQNFVPQLNVASIDGLYRLRWTFVAGREADASGARRVEAVSNVFRLTLAPPS